MFIACSWKNNFCYRSAFFWGFCFINSIHYPLSLYPINYTPQLTWKCITMKSLHSMCVCDSLCSIYCCWFWCWGDWKLLSPNSSFVISAKWFEASDQYLMTALQDCWSVRPNCHYWLFQWQDQAQSRYGGLATGCGALVSGMKWEKNYVSDASLVFWWHCFFPQNGWFWHLPQAGLSSGPRVASSFIHHGLMVLIYHTVSKQVPG